ncbi:hypothetical protein C8R43DRAFT_834844, partial [Mycena crocata]
LPAPPQIFRGREAQLTYCVSQLVSPETSRITILGPGGIRKSSLALAALHHSDVISAFGDNRYFIPLDSASSSTDMLSLIAAYFGLEQHGKVAKRIIQRLSELASPSVLVLDNFESPWEAQMTRSATKDILSHL